MRQGVEVTYADGTVIEGVAMAPQIVAFERKYDVAWGAELRNEYVLFIAHQAMLRADSLGEHSGADVPRNFEAFLALEPDVKLTKAGADPKATP